MKVLKFGGTSMANADSIKKVAEIVRADKTVRAVVVSAPGKREIGDAKVTDLLYDCYNIRKGSDDCSAAFKKVTDRFGEILTGLGLGKDFLDDDLKTVRRNLDTGAGEGYVASRGEYLSAKLFAAYIGGTFVDAAETVRFSDDGEFDAETTERLVKERISAVKGIAVIPGFYGSTDYGKIVTFSRGGSDVTGAIIAGALNVAVYENWTDVDGFLTCDPRIVVSPRHIGLLTYGELRELSYMGANVLHPDSIFPIRKTEIPIHIKNTFNPAAPGTMIVSTKKYLKGEYVRPKRTITGIAGRKDFMAIHVEKSMMNVERGFACKLLSILDRYGVSLEHMPSGIDTLSVVFDATAVDRKTINAIVEEIRTLLKPDKVEVVPSLALIAVVGHGMASRKGTATDVFESLYEADVNIRMIDQGSSEMNIIVAVENSDFETAIRALYEKFEHPSGDL